MNLGRVKQDNAIPLIILLISAVSALILRFELTDFKIVALLFFVSICFYSYNRPWLLLFSSLVLLFSIEPVPVAFSLREIIVLSGFAFYTCFTYLNNFWSEKEFILKSHILFLLLVLFSLLIAIRQEITITEWFRGIGPFLLLYLMIPISLSLKTDFEYKTKWIFISFLLLAFLLISYINIVFFTETLDKIYNQNNPQTLFQYRITNDIAQTTSELLPISLIAFFIFSLFNKNKYLSVFALLLANCSLFTILETYTRSMLMSVLFTIGLLGLFLAFFNKALLKKYLILAGFLLISGISFIHICNISPVWLDRLQVFTKTMNNLYFTSSSQIDNKINKNNDMNLLIRLKEYQIAWSTFLKHPIGGAGLGSKHNSAKQQLLVDSDANKKIGYVHNWFFYWLMAGGMIGFIFYCCVLFLPLVVIVNLENKYYFLKTLTCCILINLCLYTCFFPVFRLPTYNVLLAVICGIALNIKRNMLPAKQYNAQKQLLKSAYVN